MDDHYSPLGWAYFNQDEGIEEFKQYLLYTTELEATILSAKEEIAKRELDIINLKDLLARTVKERNEAQNQCQQLQLDKILQQQLLQQLQQEIRAFNDEAARIPGTKSNEDSSKNSESNHDEVLHDPNKVTTTAELELGDPILQQAQESPIPDVISELAAGKPLPKKGKLLQAVKDAGPLLKTILLAGPLPQWQHPPPQLDSIEIPPVTISSPSAQLIPHDPFSSSSPCLSQKRALEPSEGSDPFFPSPSSKYPKIVLH